MMEDSGRGWRRLVASPEPLEIVEEPVIRMLLNQDVIVVAGGGGGIPVIRNEDGGLEGVAAVIDKDLTASLLAKNLGARMLLISTSVHKVAINYGRPEQQDLDTLTVAEARECMAAGHFAPGSMRPKIRAAIDFLEQGGEKVIITEPELMEDAIHGRNGTHIIP